MNLPINGIFKYQVLATYSCLPTTTIRLNIPMIFFMGEFHLQISIKRLISLTRDEMHTKTKIHAVYILYTLVIFVSVCRIDIIGWRRFLL